MKATSWMRTTSSSKGILDIQIMHSVRIVGLKQEGGELFSNVFSKVLKV